MEIISPGSRGTDRGDKFYEYERGAVKEYWLIDPERRRAEFYQLGRDKQYHLMPVDEDGIFRSVALKGVWLDVAWLWQRHAVGGVCAEEVESGLTSPHAAAGLAVAEGM